MKMLQQYRDGGYLVIDHVIPMDEVERLRLAAADPAVKTALDHRGYSDKTVHLPKRQGSIACDNGRKLSSG